MMEDEGLYGTAACYITKYFSVHENKPSNHLFAKKISNSHEGVNKVRALNTLSVREP